MTVAPVLREVTSGLRFPEGPVAMADGSVLLVEIERGTLTRVRRRRPQDHVVAAHAAGRTAPPSAPTARSTSATTAASPGTTMPSTACVPTGQADDYSGGRIERVDLATGRLETLYTQCDGHMLRGPNDLVFDAHGGFYFTDLGKVRASEMDRGGVYYAKADGSPIKVVAQPTITRQRLRALAGRQARSTSPRPKSARLWAMDIPAPGEVRSASRGPRRTAVGCSAAPAALPALRQHGRRQRRQRLRRHADPRRHHRVQPGRQELRSHIPMPDRVHRPTSASAGPTCARPT